MRQVSPATLQRLQGRLPLAVFDGECNFCRYWVARWKRLAGPKFHYAPSHEVAAEIPEIPEHEFGEAMQLVDEDGRVYSGAHAVFRLLRDVPGWGWLARQLEAFAPARAAVNGTYRYIAQNRMFFSQLTRLLWGRDPAPNTFFTARRLFAHGLGLIFLVAFWSLAVQVVPLLGSRGLMPAAELLPAAKTHFGAGVYTQLPTVFWWHVSDAVLAGACWVGVGLSALLALGIAPAACALLCWVLYLSLCTVGSPFLNFQWDALLLEAGLISVVFLPWRLWPRWGQPSHAAELGRWLLWWLLFRLMFESGVVKLASGDSTWAGLTAMLYHYETQPLPLPTARWVHHLPAWLHQLEVIGTFAVEFGAALAIFAPRRVRHLAAAAMVALQLGILFTGNFAFFNWLTIFLCVPLLDDTLFPTRLRRYAGVPTEETARHPVRWPFRFVQAGAVVSVMLTGALLVQSFRSQIQWPQWFQSFYQQLAPLRSFNAYGLFAIMTRQRLEIIVEGSDDGTTWKAYEFLWKPGDVHRAPTLVAPHQPRLDWQMWFAALSRVQDQPWFIRFLTRLLEGEKQTTAMLAVNPFPDHPPKFVRAVAYDYHYAKPGSPDGAWWTRKYVGEYCPVISLQPVGEKK